MPQALVNFGKKRISQFELALLPQIAETGEEKLRPKNEPALQRVEQSFAIVSVVLLAIFSFGLAHRWIGERQALQSFERQKTAAVAS